MNKQRQQNPYTSFENLPLFLTVSELAEVLGVGKNTAYTFVRSGTIQYIQVGRQIRIPKDEVERFQSGNS